MGQEIQKSEPKRKNQNPALRDKKGRYVRGTCGNPGGKAIKPFTKILEKLTDENGDELASKILELAIDGDTAILGHFIRYGLPRGRKTQISGLTGPKPAEAILQATERGHITSEEAVGLSQVVKIAKIEHDVADLKAIVEDMRK